LLNQARSDLHGFSLVEFKFDRFHGRQSRFGGLFISICLTRVKSQFGACRRASNGKQACLNGRFGYQSRRVKHGLRDEDPKKMAIR
jgi:hypothetical protein